MDKRVELLIDAAPPSKRDEMRKIAQDETMGLSEREHEMCLQMLIYLYDGVEGSWFTDTLQFCAWLKIL